MDPRGIQSLDAIDDAARWPQWWKGVTRAELLEPGADDGVGRLWRYTWRSRLPYDLTFESRVTRRQRPYLLEGDADGELIGFIFVAQAGRFADLTQIISMMQHRDKATNNALVAKALTS